MMLACLAATASLPDGDQDPQVRQNAASTKAKPGREATAKKRHFCKAPGSGLQKEGRGIQRLYYLFPSYDVSSYISETVLSPQKLVASRAAEVEVWKLAEAESCFSFYPCRGGE